MTVVNILIEIKYLNSEMFKEPLFTNY